MNPRSVKVKQEMHYYSITDNNDLDLVDLVADKRSYSKPYTFLRSYHVICDVSKR